MTWAIGAEAKLRHLRDYARDQIAGKREGEYGRGFKEAMKQIADHTTTLLDQLWHEQHDPKAEDDDQRLQCAECGWNWGVDHLGVHQHYKPTADGLHSTDPCPWCGEPLEAVVSVVAGPPLLGLGSEGSGR